jgi:serine/threonine protein kinase
MNNLTFLRTLNHPHLITPIAGFKSSNQNGQEMKFLFPWADGGSLGDLWKEYPAEIQSSDVVRWMLLQMQGISSALDLLADKGYRHSDLKPENLLCFRKDGNIVLKITDVGISRFHLENTTMRPQDTQAKNATHKYAAPEFEGLQPEVRKQMSLHVPTTGGQDSNQGKLSRRFDIWSLGCIFLEALTWVYQGPLGLLEFGERLKQARYYKEFWEWKGTTIKTQVVSCKVVEQINVLRDQCGERSSALLDLIEGRMLVVRYEDRATAREVLTKINDICDGDKAENGLPALFSSRVIPRQHTTIPSRPYLAEPTQHQAQPPPRRESFLAEMDSTGAADLGPVRMTFSTHDVPTAGNTMNGALDTVAASNVRTPWPVGRH